MEEKRRWLKTGNHKLTNNVKVWSIPSGMAVCGRVCKGCYAIKAQVGRYGKSVVKAREARLTFSKTDKFVEDISGEIQRSRKSKYVRIHESGEFYSQEYIDKWVKIAKRNPKTVFYTYSKRLADFDFSELKKQPNVVVIDSLKYGSLNYGEGSKVKALAKAAGSFLCPDHKATERICGGSCTYCMTKKAQEKGVFFVKH